MVANLSSNFICVSSFHWISAFCLCFHFGWCFLSSKVRLRKNLGWLYRWFCMRCWSSSKGHSCPTSVHFSCFGASLFVFFFLDCLSWALPQATLSKGVHGYPGDAGPLSYWTLWMLAPGSCVDVSSWSQCRNSAFLATSFFDVSWDLLSSAWLLFQCKLWSLRPLAVTL